MVHEHMPLRRHRSCHRRRHHHFRRRCRHRSHCCRHRRSCHCHHSCRCRHHLCCCHRHLCRHRLHRRCCGYAATVFAEACRSEPVKATRYVAYSQQILQAKKEKEKTYHSSQQADQNTKKKDVAQGQGEMRDHAITFRRWGQLIVDRPPEWGDLGMVSRGVESKVKLAFTVTLDMGRWAHGTTHQGVGG